MPFDIDRQELTNRIGNKMIRPTTVPQSLEELFIEQAIAREALRLSFKQHNLFNFVFYSFASRKRNI